MHTVLLVQYSLLSYRAIDFTETIRFYNKFFVFTRKQRGTLYTSKDENVDAMVYGHQR